MYFQIKHIISLINEAKVSRFYTTLDVVQSVMGVPMAAIQAIARNAGIDDKMQVGACIDENALSYFADAYIRKVKSYFKKTRAIYNQLGINEQMAFRQFCTEFNKQELPFPEASTWNDIDVDAIRNQFYYDVRKQSSKEVSLFDSILNSYVQDIQDIQVNTPKNHTFKEEAERRAMIMRKVTRSYLFNAKLKKTKNVQHDNTAIHLLQVIAHYHIYILSDEDDHLYSIVTYKRKHALYPMSNNTPKMVA